MQRRNLAKKLGSQRLLKITFHTFRHWRGTMEYHKTKDIIHVQELLGYKSIENTMLYISIENALLQQSNDEYHCKTALRIFQLLDELNRKLGLTVVLVEHRLDLASRYASRLIVMNQGRIVLDGDPATLFHHRLEESRTSSHY
ncbi:MAG: tyrosine-type recombinase/integrase [Candidatus Bathyarchaeia archaeon]